MGFAIPALMIAGVAGAGISAYGQIAGGQAAAANANYQAQVANNNAVIARQNAQWETQAGDVRATNQGLKTRAQVGAIKVAQAASGVDVNTGSAAQVSNAADELGMLDALTIRSDTARKAYGYEVAATGEDAKANLLRTQADQAQTAGIIGGIGSLLSGASTVGSQWSKWQTAGTTA